jgi:hypothetical protein
MIENKMKQYNLFDKNFLGCEKEQGFDAASKTKPEKGSWIRDQLNWPGATVFTDDMCFTNTVDVVSSKIKIAWLLESPGVKSYVYENINQVQHKFDYVFTFLPDNLANELKIKKEKYVHCHLGGAWVSFEEASNKKTKLVSLIASEKNYLPGHQLRHEIAKKIGGIDLYGKAYKPIKNKSEALDEYAFSFVVENFSVPGYFTEKLIDSFLRKTIPVYWGDPNIINVFNKDGIIFLNDLQNINFDFYNSKLETIEENYNIALKYKSNDDNIFEKINELEK